jgi:uncharacterized membrane protein
MPGENPRSTARIAKHPIHPMLVPFPIVCFVGTSDRPDLLAYRGHDVGRLLRMASGRRRHHGLARRVRRVDRFPGRPAGPRTAVAWPHAIGNAVALVLATLNMLVHTRDAWTSVVPWGFILSAVVVLILLFTGWMGWSMVYRHGVGVVTHD